MKRALPAALAALLLLGGCGLHPLYGGGGSGPVASGLASIEVGNIAGRAGWLTRTALIDRISAGKAVGTPRYRLEVELDDQITGYGVRRDTAITRERRTLRARYRLVDVGNGSVVLDAAADADAGLDVVGSEYATIAAEQTVQERLAQSIADQIVTRIALFVRRSQPQ
ncbi:LPS assembly lipoprotein LptE [Flavisphingomonas formosensis]|uniref:LPS assembly lipoprotein LptE n=1 Tax=Flavisphingomonas formosensis TaxID=861534 RepID=UPI0012FA9A61|nr:LPS assembly lipoprotein LptE [Sphingomonas formosensis]